MLTRPAVVVAVLTVQTACAAVFVSDILLSIVGVPVPPLPWRLREIMEMGAALGLVLGVAAGAMLLRVTIRRTRRAEAAFRVASGAFMQVVDEHLDNWGLTPAEREVALFALKGLSLSDIARLRGTSEGTVKAQTNAIYRKAGVTGRTQLLSLFVDELMDVNGVVPSAET
ncbi:helix-turn-helix transcriptional regulator [Rhodobacterales bacterium HKCCE3408]|nr:helix-turn-helix transcriptional regulator [Rhodobacterales bacterium HKCCE3408]